MSGDGGGNLVGRYTPDDSWDVPFQAEGVEFPMYPEGLDMILGQAPHVPSLFGLQGQGDVNVGMFDRIDPNFQLALQMQQMQQAQGFAAAAATAAPPADLSNIWGPNAFTQNPHSLMTQNTHGQDVGAGQGVIAMGQSIGGKGENNSQTGAGVMIQQLALGAPGQVGVANLVMNQGQVLTEDKAAGSSSRRSSSNDRTDGSSGSDSRSNGSSASGSDAGSSRRASGSKGNGGGSGRKGGHQGGQGMRGGGSRGAAGDGAIDGMKASRSGPATRGSKAGSAKKTSKGRAGHISEDNN
ncbi:unnamed protein product, partial [Discosporangium mesarthrocarpum]